MYRIKSPLEEYERVVKEDLLVKSAGYLPEEARLMLRLLPGNTPATGRVTCNAAVHWRETDQNNCQVDNNDKPNSQISLPYTDKPRARTQSE
jgi:hypothetical protein